MHLNKDETGKKEKPGSYQVEVPDNESSDPW